MFTVVDKKGGQCLLQIFAKIKLIATGPKSEVLTTLVKKNLKTIMVRITNLVKLGIISNAEDGWSTGCF
jgi:hypothetical protein